jgi:alginate O-acetyltransferase complex protein AlgF
MPYPATARRARVWPGLVLAALLVLPAAARAQQIDPYGDCCVAQVTMTEFNAWQVICGSCAANPGTYTLRQPDPEKLVFVGPGGETAPSRYEAAAAICRCPSQKARQANEKKMRTFDGN